MPCLIPPIWTKGTHYEIFTNGHTADEELRDREVRGDVLLQTANGDYYELNFLTVARIKAEFSDGYLCYLETNMVILHDVTTENILKSVAYLHRWMFYERWIPLSQESLDKYYMPRDAWVI